LRKPRKKKGGDGKDASEKKWMAREAGWMKNLELSDF